MLDALYISATGLRAQQSQLDTLAGNISNVNTPAFKRQSMDFSAVLDRTPSGTGVAAAPSGSARRPLLTVDWSHGDPKPTGRALDLAIVGNGFFEVEVANGETGYSRSGSLKPNADGGLSLASGHALKADIRIPAGAGQVEVSPDGTVMAMLPGDRTPTSVGRIELAVFANPESLIYRGEGVFTAPDGADDLVRAIPGEDGAGRLTSRSLEASNVRLVDEMVALMLMQRIYELNSKVAQASDELMGMSNNLRRG
jgi:flagellar basal-body rod protein FlgG